MPQSIDDILDQQATPTRDPVDAALDRMDAASTARVKRSLLQTAGSNPDQVADARRLAVKFNEPAPIVERNLEAFKAREAADRPLDQMRAQTPALSTWLEHPDNAAIAKDDLENLGFLEWITKAPQRAFAQGVNQIQLARLRTKEVRGEALTPYERDLVQTTKMALKDGGAQGADNWFKGAVTGGANLLAMVIGGAEESLKYAAAGGAGAASVGAVMGGGVPGAAAGLAVGLPVGAAYGAFHFGFELEAGLAYDEFADLTDHLGRPLDPAAARMAAMAAGAINGGLELVQLEKLAETIPGFDRLQGALTRGLIKQALKSPTVAAALASAGKSYAGTLAVESVTEAAQRAVTVLSGEMAKIASGPDFERLSAGSIAGEVGSEFVGALQAFALLPIPGIVSKAAIDIQTAARAKHNAEIFKVLGEGIQQSKTVARMPAAAQDFLEQATKDGPIKTVYAPVESWTKYWQDKGLDPAAVAAEVLGSDEVYTRALESGADLAIPTAAYAVKLAGTEHNAFFSQELRLHENEMNAREALAFEEQQKQLEQQAAGPATDALAEKRAAMVEQLVTSAQFPRGIAEQYADVVMAFETLGERAGVDLGYTLDVSRGPRPTSTVPAAPVTLQEVSILERRKDEQPAPGGVERRAPANATEASTLEDLRARGIIGGGDINAPINTTSIGAAAAQMLSEDPTLAKRAEQMRAGSQPKAVFLTYGPAGPMYNVIGGPADKSTKDAAGLEALGIPIPETPADTGERLNGEQVRQRMLDARAAEEQNVASDTDAAAGGAQDGEDRRPTIDRIAESTPDERRTRIESGRRKGKTRVVRETATERDARRKRHYAEVFNAIRNAAKQLDPSVDVKVLRAAFNERILYIEEAYADYAASGDNPRQLLEAIAASGGISMRAEEGNFELGGMVGELKWIRQSGAMGTFGSFAGVRGVFQTESNGGRGQSLDDIVTRLRQDERFNYIEDINGLLLALEDISRLEHVGKKGAVTFPGTDELRRMAGINPATDWWKPAEEQQYHQGLFDEEPGGAPVGVQVETKDANTTVITHPNGDRVFVTFHSGYKGAKYAARYLPKEGSAVDVGRGRFATLEEAVAAGQAAMPPIAEAPFSLTSEVSKRKGKQETLFQSAYHGSPHVFDRFSLHAIGSGEGAQAYGWGLYFASQRETAEFYRDALSQGQKILIDGGADIVPRSSLNTNFGDDLAILHLADNRHGPQVTETIRRGFSKGFADAYEAGLAKYRGRVTVEHTGRVYVVDIPDDSDYLEWDKPLAEQSPKVRAALEKLGFKIQPFTYPTLEEGRKLIDQRMGLRFGRSMEVDERLLEGRHYTKTGDEDAFRAWWRNNVNTVTLSKIPRGQDVYLELAAKLAAEHGPESWTQFVQTVNDTAGNMKAASQALAAHGVAGIRYLDGVSRSSGQGSSNYVVFDDRLVKIQEFYQPFFHGSPHSFDKFSLEHVGSGEGAAAYGWGLYFAENLAVARDYQKRLSTWSTHARYSVKGIAGAAARPLEDGPERHAAALLAHNERREILASTKRWIKEAEAGDLGMADTAKQAGLETVEYWKRLDAFARAHTKRDIIIERGSLYQVEIADEHIDKMLDLDAPLADQPAAVKDLVRAHLMARGYLRPTDAGPRQLTAAWKAYVGEHGGMIAGDTGHVIYDTLLDGFRDPKAASMALLNVGVPGNKYFDEGSRGKQRGTRNVVVFDDAIITLTHRDGSPVSQREREEFFQSTQGAPQPNGALEQPKRGSIRFTKGGKDFQLEMLAKADLSTFLHEFGHLGLEVFGDVADRLAGLDPATLTPAQQNVLADYRAALAFLGVESRDQIQDTHHEKWARAFEAYLFEGKAPSIELRSAFASFRAWLVGIYRSLKSLNVELTDDVRGVFDRLLATDDAIATAEAQGQMAPMFLTAQAAGMSPAQFELYRGHVAEASRRAQEALQSKMLADVQRAQKAEWKRRRDEIAVDVAAEVYNRPAYLALAAIQRGTYPDGTPLGGEQAEPEPVKLSRQEIVEQFGKARLARLPKPFVYARDGGISLAAAAEMFGFSSGDELLTALEQAWPMKTVIDEETDRRMVAEQGSLLLDGTLYEKANAAVSTDARDSVIRAELRALAELRRTVTPHVEQAVGEERRERDYERRWFAAEEKLKIAMAEGRKQVEIDELQDEVDNLKRKAAGGPAVIGAAIPPASFIQERARSSAARTRVRDIRPALYWSAARKASQAATNAAARQDFDAAILAKQQELLNLALFREASAALEDADARAKRARDLGRVTTQKRLGLVDATFLDQVNQILARYEFAEIPTKTLDERVSLRKWAAAMEAEGLPVDIADAVLEDARQINYRELTYEELRGVSDALTHIAHLAGIANRQQATAAAVAFAGRRDAVLSSILALNKNKGIPIEFDAAANRRRGWADWFASHTKIATLARSLDGHQDGGALWEALIRPINKAADDEHTRKGKAAADFLAILERAYPGRELGRLKDKLFIAELNTSLSKEARLSVALNWGNQTSRDRLLSDPVTRWSQPQIDAILATLDKRDWDFVQNTWDYLNTFWPEIAAKTERMTGLPPEKVEALAVVTPFGVYAGGYYPLKYDSRKNIRALQNEQASEAKLATAAAYVRATTKRGHLEARKQKVHLSVRFELGVIGEHVEQVIHDLTHHEVLLDATRLLRDPKISRAILETRGDAVYRQFSSALQDIAIGQGARNEADNVATFMRTGTQVVGLGWNLWTAAQQPLGLFNGMSRVGPVWVAKGLGRWLRDAATMEATTKWIAEVSPFMRDRHATATQDLAQLHSDLQAAGGWFDTLVRTVSADHLTQQHVLNSYLWHIGLMQRVADIPTWLGGYEKAMAAGNDEARAVALADQAVIDSQGSGHLKDLSKRQRGGPIAKLYMTFYSYGATVFNETADRAGATDYRSPTQVAELLGHLALIYVMPAMATVALANAFGRRNDDEPDEWLKAMGSEVLATALNTQMYLRELGGLVGDGVRGYEGPAGARIFQLLFRLKTQVEQGKGDEALFSAANQVAGVLWRYPAGQVDRTVKGAMALIEGKTNNPMSLLMGPPKK